MKAKFADKVFRLIFILVFVMGIAVMPGESAKAQGPGPSISVLPEDDVIHALNWPLGVLLRLEIDNPGTSQTPDYATSHVVLGPTNYEKIELGGIFDIQPGHLVTVSDGNSTRQHVVTHLAVTNIDMHADTISGIANPGSSIYVTTNCDANGCARRNVIADEQGNWLANFAPVSEPSQGDGVFDVRLASGGTVHELDEDGDTTRIPWIMTPPTIGVDVDIDRVQGWDWPLGAMVNFEIDNPLTPENPDYTNSVIVEAADWDPNLMYFTFHTNEYDVKPGDIVTATDGNITKQLIVTHFRITGADLDLDIVYGIAEPSQVVRIWSMDPHASRHVTADQDGNWSANFAFPGDEDSEQGTIDIRNGSGFDSFVGDEDWDCTRSMWDVPNPIVEVRPNYDEVQTYIWDMGNTLTLEIDDPSTADTPDYTATQTVTDVAPWDPSQTYVLFNLSSVYDIQIGDVVEISNGSITKTIVVSDLAITNVQLDTDIVEGTAEPGQTINVWTCWQDVCVSRDETTDDNGSWLTNFAAPGEQDWEQETLDVQVGSWIDSSVSDEDGDSTLFGWYVSMDETPPTITWMGNIREGDSFYFGFVPPEPACTASDDHSDAGGACTVTGYTSTVGTHTLTATARDNADNIATETRSYTVLAWTMKGFYQPVDMNGIYNVVKGGSTVPLKFEIFAGSTELTDLAYIKSLTYSQTSCDANVTTDEIEMTVTGGTSLRYDMTAGQFSYNWKTLGTTGKCYRVTMTTIDGSSLVAYFKLK